MNADTQREIIRGILEQLAQKTTDMVDSDVVIDARRYHDPERLRREEEILLRRYPLLIAHASELSHPGDFLTHDDSGTPILIIRGEDHQLRAFLNICRHRGTRLATGPRGQARGALTCSYHAWSYRLNGELLHVPHPEGFPTLDRCKNGLVPLPLQEIAGLIFVTPDGTGTAPAHSFFPIDSDLTAFGAQSHVVFDRRQWRRDFNWKIAVDGFFENYHVRTAHRDSIYPFFLDHVGRFETVGMNLRLLAPRRSIVALSTVPEDKWELRPHAALAYFLFPNTVILVQPDHIILFMFYPRGTDAAIVEQVLLVPNAPNTDKARQHWEKNLGIILQVFEEDFAIGEQIQRGVRTNPGIRLGRFEKAIIAFHATLDATLGFSRTS